MKFLEKSKLYFVNEQYRFAICLEDLNNLISENRSCLSIMDTGKKEETGLTYKKYTFSIFEILSDWKLYTRSTLDINGLNFGMIDFEVRKKFWEDDEFQSIYGLGVR